MARIAGTLWEGVGLRRMRAAADPDAPPRAVALPIGWDDDAAAGVALAALAPGQGPVTLPGLAEGWIGRLVALGRRNGLLATPAEAEDLADSLRALLLARRGAPGVAVWRGETDGEDSPRFVLNLPAFLDADGGFDAAGLAEAVALAVRALDILGGKAARLRVGFADLAGLLAGLGLEYDSPEGRATGAAIAALTRGAAMAESGRLAGRHGARAPLALAWPSPPEATPVPGLAAAARAALDAAAAAPEGLRHAALVALAPADAVEALLGAETGGIAPAAAGPTRLVQDPATDGAIREAPTRAARRAGWPAARAAELLAPVPQTAREAMGAAVAPWLHAPVPAPVARAAPPRPAAPPPLAASARRTGATWRVTVGGHRVALRTTEDAAGRLQEIAFTLSKEGAAFRSLMDGFAQSVSLGLARGVPLADYVEAFAYTRFGPAGVVEGDPAIPRATSMLDWAFRRLALDYLGRCDLPQPGEEDCAPDAIGSAKDQALPLLPLDLPAQAAPRAKRRGLRVVT